MPKRAQRTPRSRSFTEKSFYLGEFRDRTLAIALAPGVDHEAAPLEAVLKELEANPTDVVLVGSDAAQLSRLVGTSPMQPGEGLEGRVWRGLRLRPRVAVGLAGDGADWAASATGVALRLGVPKLVCLDPKGGLLRDGRRQSFVGLEELSGLLRGDTSALSAARVALLGEIERALRVGLRAVNLCTSRGLADELFTYAGSGTLFTRERYVEVRRLCIDDYDAADDLIARGVSEGYLATRGIAELDRVFANGYGAFVEGRHLAGIGALLPCSEVNAGEIVSLYTLTRFMGEGIGGHLVSAMTGTARERGFDYVFACTTTERVAGFFERNHFRRVPEDQIPDEKWRNYDQRRRPKVRCVRRELR
ncbi:MAG: GNAT family N-acetyltransferase [Myxococcota bacterium]